MISDRLLHVANYVDFGSKVADIGTDHAYIPIYLLQNKIATFALVSDIKIGPINIAKRNILKYNLTDKVRICVADGISGILENEVDTVIIAGMGGQTIVDILSYGLQECVKTIILQPMTDVDIVRKYVQTNGFGIVGEAISKEGNKFYNILKCTRGKAITQDIHLPQLLKTDPLFIDYCNHKLKKLKKTQNQMKKGGVDTYEMDLLIKKYTEALNES